MSQAVDCQFETTPLSPQIGQSHVMRSSGHRRCRIVPVHGRRFGRRRHRTSCAKPRASVVVAAATMAVMCSARFRPGPREQMMKAPGVVDEVGQVRHPRASDHPPHVLFPPRLKSAEHRALGCEAPSQQCLVSFSASLGRTAASLRPHIREEIRRDGYEADARHAHNWKPPAGP